MGRGPSEAGPHHILHSHRNNDPRGLEGPNYEWRILVVADQK